jgi:hypothetical protein
MSRGGGTQTAGMQIEEKINIEKLIKPTGQVKRKNHVDFGKGAEVSSSVQRLILANRSVTHFRA